MPSDGNLLPRGPLVALTFYAPPDKCWEVGADGRVPCAPENPEHPGEALGPWSNPDLLWWPLGGMRLPVADKPKKVFWPLSGLPDSESDPPYWSPLAEQSQTHMQQYVPCSCSLAGTCKFYEAVPSTETMYECEEDEMHLSKAASHLRPRPGVSGDEAAAAERDAAKEGRAPSNLLSYVAPEFGERFGGAFLEHGVTSWQGITPAESGQLHQLHDHADIATHARKYCHTRGAAQLEKRGIKVLPDEEKKRALPGFLCLREPIEPWRPIVQPISHTTRSGGCAIELIDVEGRDDGADRFCVDRVDQPCLWVYRNSLKHVYGLDDSGKKLDLTSQYQRALLLLRPSFGPSPEPLAQEKAEAVVEGQTRMWPDPQADWEEFVHRVNVHGEGELEDTEEKKVAEKEASVPHSDAPFIGGNFVFQGRCRAVRRDAVPEETYAFVTEHLRQTAPRFYDKLVAERGGSGELPYCSPTSPDFEQVMLTVKSFVQSKDHYAAACARGAGTVGRKRESDGHACVMANGDDNPRDDVKKAYEQRLPPRTVPLASEKAQT